jgi:hypothetical protein
MEPAVRIVRMPYYTVWRIIKVNFTPSASAQALTDTDPALPLYSIEGTIKAKALVLDPFGLAARSDPPVDPPGPLDVSPDPPLCPPVLVVSLCPPVLLVSLLIPPRVPRCPWCLLDPTVV